MFFELDCLFLTFSPLNLRWFFSVFQMDLLFLCFSNGFIVFQMDLLVCCCFSNGFIVFHMDCCFPNGFNVFSNGFVYIFYVQMDLLFVLRFSNGCVVFQIVFLFFIYSKLFYLFSNGLLFYKRICFQMYFSFSNGFVVLRLPSSKVAPIPETISETTFHSEK